MKSEINLIYLLRYKIHLKKKLKKIIQHTCAPSEFTPAEEDNLIEFYCGNDLEPKFGYFWCYKYFIEF